MRFDLSRLHSVSGLHVAHLQCHIGTETLSLARLGAASVISLDFSSESLKVARSLASIMYNTGGSRLQIVGGDVYESIALLGAEQFDMVFTGIGALGWLPSISKWAKVVSSLLRPCGRFSIREGHPVLWALDETISESNTESQLSLSFPYFEIGRPLLSKTKTQSVDDPYAAPASEAEKHGTFEASGTSEFNHGLGEITQALIDAGMTITMVQEHDSVPCNALPGRMEKGGTGEYKLKKDRWRPHAHRRSRQ